MAQDPDNARRVVAPAALLALVGVLAVVAHGLHAERSRITQEHLETQHILAREASMDLADRLRGLEEDARLIAGFVERTDDAALQPAAQLRVLTAAAEALVSVVRPYRRISVHDAAGRELAHAADPTRGAELTGPAAQQGAREASLQALQSRRSVFVSRLESGSRALGFYALPTADSHAVVIVTDVGAMLSSVLRPRTAAGRFVVVDPASTVWIGCGQPGGCEAVPMGTWVTERPWRLLVARGGEDEGVAFGEADLARALALPERDVLTAWQAARDPTGGRWVVTTVLSSAVQDAAESAVIERLAATGGAIVLALGGLAALIIRQQQRNARLGVRLLQAQEIARVRERSDLIINQVPVGILGISKSGNIVFANRFLEERLGPLTRGAPLGTAAAALPGNIAHGLVQAVDGVVLTGEARLLRPPDSDGASEVLDVRVVPVADSTQDVAAMVLVEDRSALRSLEKQLVRAEKLATVGVLTAGIAHEVGTPLGIIRGRAEILLERAGAGPESADLGMIVSQIDRITGIIRQLLDFASAQPVERRPVALAEAVRVVEDFVGHRFRARRVELRCAVTDGLPPVAANPHQLQQVLLNLLLNACDACAHGGCVRLVVERSAAGAVIEISDDGCGIAQEHLNAVFDPFFTTKKRGEGTGLGLPVAASIVQNHGGQISLASDAGQGTRVRVVWPLALEVS